VRVREAGGESFADVVIGVSRLEGLERSHQTMDRVEDAVRSLIGPAQVTVHVEPIVRGEAANERVAAAALRVPGVVETHNITVLEEGRAGGRAITLHVRLPQEMPLRQAGQTVERLKQEIRSEFGVARVYAHVEPSALGAQPARDVAAERPQLVQKAREAVHAVAGGAAEVVVYQQGERLLVVTSLPASDQLTVREAHMLASRVEDAVRDALDAVDDVIVEVSTG
jgi:divalent metal cation (Fe/Co/Zn/Cd) transporter